MRHFLSRLAVTAVVAATSVAGVTLPAAAVPATATPVHLETAAASRADKAIAWFAARNGSTAYQGYCEKAVENAYGRTGVYASAIANWNHAVRRGAAHRGDLNPPKGALVFWNISAYGHVGVAKGDGTFWATSVGGRIGSARLPYFSNYLGWAQPNF